jgi:3-isopropylmalate/(R)-2-methylmalate dehydratase large subunit
MARGRLLHVSRHEPDQLKPRAALRLDLNRNFEGRQGYRAARTWSRRQMAAAAAIAGHFVDVRTFG